MMTTYAGIILMSYEEMQLSDNNPEILIGIALVLGAALLFSGAYVAAGTYTKRLGSRRYTGTAMTAACCGN